MFFLRHGQKLLVGNKMQGMKRLAIISSLLILAACGSSNSGYSDDDYKESGYRGNPYSEGTGHYAGYEWAERTGEDCDGNSQSFNEGCEEYYRQISNQ
jgi:hypothetical protein